MQAPLSVTWDLIRTALNLPADVELVGLQGLENGVLTLLVDHKDITGARAVIPKFRASPTGNWQFEGWDQ